MNKFQNLFENLQTDLVIFIDDDFTPVTGYGEILYFLTLLNEIDYVHFEKKLTGVDPELIGLLSEFRLNFRQVEIDNDDKNLLEIGEIISLLDHKNQDALKGQAENLLRMLSTETAKAGSNFAATVMNYGLTQFSGGATCYKPFFETVNRINPRKSVRIYTGLEGQNFTDFETEIHEVLERSNNQYFLLIVDKKLANNKNGKEIIDDLRKNENGINAFFSILFTSDAAEGINPSTSLQHYHHFEIQKPEGESDATESVADGLAISAYATFFFELGNLRKSALEKANNLVIDSGKENILYLAEMAHAEGETVFKAVNRWFDLLVNKKINDRMARKDGDTLDFHFMIGLTALINSNFLPVSKAEISEEFRREIQGVSQFEIFDFNINEFYSPPAAGDIYEIDSTLYILTGQECDLIVRAGRGKISRKETEAAMVKCVFSNIPLDAKISETDKTFSVNYFSYNEKSGSLKIEFNDRALFDFKLLDLCSLNNTGESVFPPDGLADKFAHKALPKMWIKYYPDLFTQIKDKIKIFRFLKDQNISSSIISSDKTFALEYTEEGNSVKFPIKRIARLKGQYKDYFLQRYWEYKTRKGLDTILPYNRKPTIIHSLERGFHGDWKIADEKPEVWLQLTGNVEKNKDNDNLAVILLKHDILLHLDDSHKELFSRISSDEIIIDKKETVDEQTLISFKRNYNNNELSIKITFPFFNAITKTYFHINEAAQLQEIFPPKFLNGLKLSEEHYIYEGEKLPLKEKYQKRFSVDELEKGVEIPFLKVKFILDKTTGVLSKVTEEDGSVRE